MTIIIIIIHPVYGKYSFLGVVVTRTNGRRATTVCRHAVSACEFIYAQSCCQRISDVATSPYEYYNNNIIDDGIIRLVNHGNRTQK